MSQAKKNSLSSDNQDMFGEGGEMAALVQRYDWHNHPLGAPTQWPQSLRTGLQMILGSGHPMFIWWSEDFYMFHNDAYLPALGKKHPRALGAKARDMWREIWDQLGVIAEDIFRGGKQYYAEDLLVVLERNDFLEETYWTFSYSQMPNDDGSIGGIFCACNEVTGKVLNQRRLKTLKEITDTAVRHSSADQLSQQICDIIAQNSADIPFGLMYLLDTQKQQVRLGGQSTTLPSAFAPKSLDTTSPAKTAPWPLANLLKTKQPVRIKILPNEFSQLENHQTPSPTEAVMIPLLKPDKSSLLGFLILGLSPRLDYGHDYQNFHSLLSNQITTILVQVQAKLEAQRQQARLLNLFKQAPVAIAILRGPEFIVEVANPKGSEVWGLSLETAIGRPLFDVFPEVRGQGFEELLEGVLRSGQPFVGSEIPVTSNRNGQPLTEYFSFVYQPWRDENNQITGIITVATNVSEQVAARMEIEAKNQALISSNADLDRTLREKYRLTALLENSLDFIGLATPEGKGAYINPAGLEMVGLPRSQLVSELKITDFFFEEDIPYLQNTILPTLRTTGQWVGELRFRHFRTGEAIPILYNSFSVKDPVTYELIGLATITINITERKKKEAELQRYQDQLALTNQQLAAANEELAAANEELINSNDEMNKTNEQLTRVNADLDNFVYLASHDLKTPIANIEGLMNTLTRHLSPHSASSEIIQRVVKHIHTSIERFKNTITDLGQIAHLQHEVDEDVADLDIVEILKDIQAELATTIVDANAQLRINVRGCPPIRFSKKNMRNIFYNLISNAIKYRSPHRELVVDVDYEQTDSYQVLSVSDNGLGIAAVEKHKIFSMFKRLHDHVEGTGLGLYIVKKILENAGGKIKVESQLDAGTTFKVYIKR